MTSLVVILSGVLLVQAYYLIKFARTIFDFETKIENALDEIDECYGEISQVLEKPLFYDSAEVRQVLSQIKKISDIILDIARQIGTVEDNSMGE